jgi:predicted acylesterase/phospholipase RssA
MTNKLRKKTKQRAIALAGGGPAAGLHIGALAALEQAGIAFDVFTLSCVGAWVGLVYNTRQGPDRAAQTYRFFEQHAFRDDASYDWFPSNRGFATDYKALAEAWLTFPLTPGLNWDTLVQPEAIAASLRNTASLFLRPGGASPREWNDWLYNDVLAVNPWTRYATAMLFKSRLNGLSRIYYDGHPVLQEMFGDGRLAAEGMPEIYHNAWRMPRPGEPGRMQIFHNRRRRSANRRDEYLPISAKSLCACSALPYIEESVTIDGVEYTEGALLDTVNFVNLLRDHPGLDEVWVSRIVDDTQVRPARNLADALGNLPMQFAAEIGEDDIKLFREHLANQSAMRPRVVEIPIHPNTQVTFEWKHGNLRQGYQEGYEAVQSLLRFDGELRSHRV